MVVAEAKSKTIPESRNGSQLVMYFADEIAILDSVAYTRIKCILLGCDWPCGHFGKYQILSAGMYFPGYGSSNNV